MPPVVEPPAQNKELGTVVFLHEESLVVPLRMTWEEYLHWMDEDKHAEWVNGKVIMHSPASRKHNQTGVFLMTLFSAWLEHTDAGELFYEPFQMKTSPDLPIRCPDLFVVLEKTRGASRKTCWTAPPTW